MSNVVDAILRRVHELCRDDTSGQVADYIPNSLPSRRTDSVSR